MDVLIVIGIMTLVIFFGVLQALIKSAVSRGIDSSKEIQLLKNEIRDLNKRMKSEENTDNHVLDEKI